MAEQNQMAGKSKQVAKPANTQEQKQEKPKPAKPAFKITSAKKRKRYLNALFYGDYGVGKSYLVATASEVPEMREVLYVNAEGGDESIKDFDLDIVDIEDYSQFARVHEFLRVHCKYRDAYQNEGDQEAKEKLKKLEAKFKFLDPADIDEPALYNTVAIDSLTEVQKYCMYQLLGIKVGEFALDIAPDQPQWDEWGKSAEMMRLLVRTFRDLPINTLFVCGQSENQDDRKRFCYNPLLPGKLANEVQGFFDVVGYMIAAPTEGGEMLRRLWLEPGQTFKAKNRFKDFTDRYIDNPSMADLAGYTLAKK